MMLIYSAMLTPDGTLLNSKNRHDCVTHIDKNGKRYMLDGGIDYIRSSIHNDQRMIQLYVTDSIEILRNFIRWGRNFDREMNRLPKTEFILLRDLADDHLDALCLYERAHPLYRFLFLKEKQYRLGDFENQ